ncbi:Isochorismatase hydrolase [Aureobasidium sp. EXF-10727]|nr:Isochorismatase hydrolase [Aureobasidium sp. EXF-10727]KAI4727693.1 Isochorismatase hydrolase [Aureobasidium sp. EXF-10728]
MSVSHFVRPFAIMGRERKAVIGNADNFWLHSSKENTFDLTHPQSPSSEAISPRLDLATSTTPIVLDPQKTALVIIDMQNFFLSEAFGRKKGAGHEAVKNLEQYAIPAARKAGMQVIWLNWGLTDRDIEVMPPAIKRAFGFEVILGDDDEEIEAETAEGDVLREQNGTAGTPKVKPQDTVVLENGKDKRIYKGLGSWCGNLELPDGTTVDGGRLLMRDAWNSALYPPLDTLYKEGLCLPSTPDKWINKDRMSGMWGARTDCEDFLQEKGIRSLLFAGVNTDQCVSGTFTDAFSKGYDCVMLRDACGTTSPNFSQQCIEFNAAKSWGFVAKCADLARGVENMASR